MPLVDVYNVPVTLRDFCATLGCLSLRFPAKLAQRALRKSLINKSISPKLQGLGPGGPRFESLYSDQHKKKGLAIRLTLFFVLKKKSAHVVHTAPLAAFLSLHHLPPPHLHTF